MIVLTVNTGSSSVRLALVVAERAGAARVLHAQRYETDECEAGALLAAFLGSGERTPPELVVHRVVHGGESLLRPCRIDAAVEQEIERLTVLAPLHNPVALAWIRAARKLLGAGVPQVAVFDTAFYATLPAAARAYAIPQRLAARYALRRYGFHGLAHEAMWRRWRALRPDLADGGRVITLQLGAGCSMTAIRAGQPLDTSMGFSPTEGLVMATRSGDLDPGLLTYLQRLEGLSPEATETLLNRESGLLGLAGEADMRALLAREDSAARLALEVYCRRACKYLGAYLALAGGADGVLIGGGVGENAPAVRARILGEMHWAGLVLDAERNAQAAGAEVCITDPTSPIEAWVIVVNEALVMAEAALAVAAPATH